MKKPKITLEEISSWHDRQADYWKMTRGQSWGREKSLRDSHKRNEQFHRDIANVIRGLIFP